MEFYPFSIQVYFILNLLLTTCIVSIVDLVDHGTSPSKGVWIAIVLGAFFSAVAISVIVTLLIVRRYSRHKNTMSRRRLCKFTTVDYDFLFFSKNYHV